MTERKATRLIKEGRFVAEIDVPLIEEEQEWAPYLAAGDVRKLDDVRMALRRGEISKAAKLAHVYELMPVAAE